LQNDTALIVEEDERRRRRDAGRHLGMILDSATVTHMLSHISLLYSCGILWFIARCG